MFPLNLNPLILDPVRPNPLTQMPGMCRPQALAKTSGILYGVACPAILR